MIRNALLCSVLLAACGGGDKYMPWHSTTELGTSPHQTKSTGNTPAAEKADPALAFRRAYVDPGGMWMPSQMTLPQHADNLQKMGVRLDAKQLANPLDAPLAAVVYLG